ncbi:unnamed protein product, partial [Mesorhabditis spiculigera]
MLVTYSSICGLGVTTWLGINFNAATTQIVPFLSLGLGIDDMFLLLHNYDEIINTWERRQPWYTVGGFLTNVYIPGLKKTWVKCIVTGLTIAMTVFGLVGMYNSTLGLELSDVLPEHTAPAAFMRAREKYFSFYP